MGASTDAGASGTGGMTGSGGAGGSAEACPGALSNCAGTMSGPWCVDQFFPGDASDPSFNGVWSDGPTDVWAVGSHSGANGFAFHWDGCAWTQVTVPTESALNDVWGASASDVWTVGADGTALHWNGSAWSAAATGTTGSLGNVSGTSGSDVWAVGTRGAFHWDGTTWAASPGLTVDPQNGFIGDIWAAAPNDVWVAPGFNTRGGLAHFDGTTWTMTEVSPEVDFGLFGIWSNGPTGWAVGEGNQILELNEGVWTQIQPPGGSSEGLLNIMSAGSTVSGGHDVYAVGQFIVHLSNGAFVQDTDVPSGNYTGLWLTATQVWVGGNDFNDSGDLGAVVLHRAR